MTIRLALFAWQFRRELLLAAAVLLALLVALVALIAAALLALLPMSPDDLYPLYESAAADIPDPGIDWRWLPAIHAVRLQQDFSAVDAVAIQALADRFVESVSKRQFFDWAPCPPGMLPPPDAGNPPFLPDDGLTYCPKVEYVIVLRVRSPDEVMTDLHFEPDAVEWARIMHSTLTERFPEAG